ncbi:MAG TPA: universal stress protein [Sediminibacterium sp.]|nr:universal stress protein [Sediminibacterium sp.]
MFKNILIPIDTSNNSWAGITKALEFCDASGTTLHLVKVIRRNAFFGYLLNLFRGRTVPREEANTEELEKIRQKLLDWQVPRHLSAKVEIKTGDSAGWKKFLAARNIDLIILPPNNISQALTPGRDVYQHLFQQSGVLVLTLLQQETDATIRSVLVPVPGFFPEEKVHTALEIAKKFHAQLHIVTILDDTKADVKQRIDAFYLSFKLFSAYGYSPQYKILMGKHRQASLSRYANQIKADMILMHAKEKTGLLTACRQKISDWLHPLTGVQVLTMQPEFSTQVWEAGAVAYK